MLLSVVSSSAMAEWVEVYMFEGMTTYVDPSTIRKADSRVKMWGMYDLETADELSVGRYMSSKIQVEYDCTEEQSRILAYSYHSGKMGIGKVVLSSDTPQQKWTPVFPGSTGQAMWEIACGKAPVPKNNLLDDSAVAEWATVVRFETLTTYADLATIHKNADMVKMRSLNNFTTAKTLGETTYMSSKGQREYDCKKEQSRTLYFSFHSKSFGEGEVIFSAPDISMKWEQNSPRSVNEALWKVACGKVDFSKKETPKGAEDGKPPDLVWQNNIKNFIQMVKIIEGFDYYASENSNLFTAFDSEVKRLGNDVKNADKDGYFFLRTAHKNVMNKRQSQ